MEIILFEYLIIHYSLIIIQEDIELIHERSIQVMGGRQFPADVIIFATGYTFGFPFLYPEIIIPVKVCIYIFQYSTEII